MRRVRQNSERNVLYLQVPRSSNGFVKVTELFWICPIRISSVIFVCFVFFPLRFSCHQGYPLQFQSTLLIQHSSDFGDEITMFYLKFKYFDKLNINHTAELIWQCTSIWLLTYLGILCKKWKLVCWQNWKLWGIKFQT